MHTTPVRIVRAQMDAVLGDIGADVVKTGMLPSAEVGVGFSRGFSRGLRTSGFAVCVECCNLPCAPCSAPLQSIVSGQCLGCAGGCRFRTGGQWPNPKSDACWGILAGPHVRECACALRCCLLIPLLV